jgi:hypothetical protein
LSVAAMTIPLVKVPWYKAPFLDFHDWSKAAQRLWGWLHHPSRGGAARCELRDWELAAELGVGRRCIQKALWFLERIAGVIRRFRRWGHDGRRIIEITINLAGRAPKAAPAPAAPSTAKSEAAPEPVAIPAPAPEPEPELTPEELAQAEAFRARGRELARQHADEEAARKARVTAQRLGIAPPIRDTRKDADAQKAALDAWMAARSRTGEPGEPPARE